MNEEVSAPGHVSRRRLRRWLVRGLALYLVLLAASHGVRWWRGSRLPAPPPTDRPSVEVAELSPAGELSVEPTGDTVRMTWQEWAPTDSASADTSATVLLVHGSPGSSDDFFRLGPLLAERGYRAVAPDLPGFGHSTRDVADYSILSHAGYCLELLDALGVDRVHAVGFSLGGGVVLHLEELAPRRIESITLLSAIGVQELELLGSYPINHAVHGAQLVGLAFLFEAFPHFGLLDRPFFGLPYARNFYDSDQRPLRRILEQFEGPMLILHGQEDFLVPYEAALEHARLVPQSRLVTFRAPEQDSSHFMVFRSTEQPANALAAFLEDVESGRAPRRADASVERIEAATSGTPYQLPRASGPTLMVWVLLLALATLVSEDLTCVAAGLLVAQGSLGFVPAVVGCASGIFFGDLGLYSLGRLGRPWLERAPLRWIVSTRSVKRSELWFGRRGPVVIFLSRFLPGTRVATYVAAGLLGMGLFRFALSLLIPVLIWVPMLVWVAGRLGKEVFGQLSVLEERSLPIFLGALVAVWLLVALVRGVATWRGRRGLVGRWRRWTRWEFWPPWLFYPPVIVYILWLALRHRSLTLFTAANPGLDAGGGFVGESKSAILGDLEASLRGTEADGAVASFRLLPSGPTAERLAIVMTFRASRDWPIVLKPDVGQRGSGVVIARSESDVERFLRTTKVPAIVQEYVPGPELGVFWLHRPGDEAGTIFSVTDKRLPEVVGDGQSTLERLILQDSRAVAMAPTYLDLHFDRLDTVPDAGARIRLVELGTHCRGAVFFDGRRYVTPELERALDALALPFEGFSFGRFDLRAPSLEHFQRGESIRVLEVNGVTSEATHIYDPANRLADAYRVLFRQWRLAFEIGAHHRDQGHTPVGVVSLVKMAFGFLKGKLP